ncbi:MAG: ribosome silencing factor [Niabella sp.]
MEPLASLTKRRNAASVKLTKKSKIFKIIISAILEKKGENIVSLDLRKIPEAVSDFFIVCEAGSPPQVKAIADNIEQKVKENCLENVFHKEGFQSMQWVLIDYVNIVIHVMQPETRRFYNLEEMWSDAEVEQHQ